MFVFWGSDFTMFFIRGVRFLNILLRRVRFLNILLRRVEFMNVFIHSVELSCEREGHSFSILPREIEECKRISRREAQKPHQKQRLNAERNAREEREKATVFFDWAGGKNEAVRAKRSERRQKR